MKKQNLHTELIALCDYASVSKDGKLSVNGIFDEIRVHNFPGGIARAFLVATISGTPNTNYELNLKMEEKKGAKVSLNNQVLEVITAPNGKNNLIVELINLGFEKEGSYQFKIYHDNKEVGSTLLKVFQITESTVNTNEKLLN